MKIVVIGGGPAGEAAAKAAAKAGAEVVVIEKKDLGGVCLNRGCIPSKTLLAAVKKWRDLKSAGLAAGADANAYLKRTQSQKRTVIETLRRNLAQAFQSSRIRTLHGEARFVSGSAVSVRLNGGGEATETFDRCIVAAGSEIFFPAPLDRFKDHILTSDSMLEMETVPENLLVIGGGAVGCEFACLFAELGAKVAIVEKTATLLPGEDEQIVRALRNSFEKRGIEILSDCTLSDLSPNGTRWEAALSNGQKRTADKILACVGRRPRFDHLGLDKAGVRASPKGIETDDLLATSNPAIFAVGDVNGRSLLAHAGSRQGEIAAANALGARTAYDGSLVPRCLYSWPEAASVGAWKNDAQARGIEVRTQRFFFKGSARALAENETDGFIQVLSDAKNGRPLGAQILGPHATEMIHIFSVALSRELTVQDLKDVIFAHPTFTEGIGAALDK